MLLVQLVLRHLLFIAIHGGLLYFNPHEFKGDPMYKPTPHKQESAQSKKLRRAHFPAHKTLIKLSGKDAFRIGDSFEGVQSPGSTGASKSSTTVEIWTQSYLEAQYGALCLGPKATFAEMMETISSRAGSLNRTIFLRRDEDGTARHGINLIRATAEARGSETGLEDNVTDLLFCGVESVTRTMGLGSADPFWQSAARQLCKDLIVLDRADTGTIDVRRLMALCRSMPRSPADLGGEWEDCPVLACVSRVRDKYPEGSNYAIDRAIDYVTKTAPRVGDKTFGSISISLEVILDLWCGDVVYNAVCKDAEGAEAWALADLRSKGLVVVCDYPLKDGFDVSGKVIGAAVKRAVQKQLERELRSFPSSRKSFMRPVAIIIDDAGLYANTDDLLFLQTCRDSRAAVLWAFHSISLLRDQFGGSDVALNRVKALLSFFLTVVGHQSDDEESNRFYSGRRGERLERRDGGGQNLDKEGKGSGENKNYQFVPAPDLPFWAYTTLKRGSEQNGGVAEAIVTMPRQFKANKRRWLKVRLVQRPLYHPPDDPPQSLLDWGQRWWHRWNGFLGRSAFIWVDHSPRIRPWMGHVPSYRVAGWLFLNPEKGQRLLDRWLNFWFLDREVAVYGEHEDAARLLR